MNKYQQSLIIATFLGKINTMSLKQGTAFYDDWDDDWEQPTTNSNNNNSWANSWSEEEEEDTSPAQSNSRSRRNRGGATQSPQYDSESEEEDLAGNGSTCRHCRKKCYHCDCYSPCHSEDESNGCCPCHEEFDEVHCALDDIHEKVCDIQDSQEHQDQCLGIIKGTTATNQELLENLQTDVTEILAGVDEILEGGVGGPGGPGNGNGNGDGCLVCINCGGSCCDGGCECCDIDECCPECPDLPPGGGGTDPDPCLIGFEEGTDNGLVNGDVIELWFSAKFKSCIKDFYLASSSFNWAPDGEFSCDQ